MIWTLSLAVLLILGGVAVWRWHVLTQKTVAQIVDILLTRGIRVFEVTLPERIGHFVGEPELWFKRRILEGSELTPTILVANKDTVANPHMLTYWEEKFACTITPALWKRAKKLFPAIKQLSYKDYSIMHAHNQTAGMYDIYARWGNREPLLKLRPEDVEHGRQTLRSWGLSEDDWFVCVHNRQNGYSLKDDHYHDYRNSSPESLRLAIDEILTRGGWVVRMGDPAMTKLPEMERVIDYAHSPQRSPRLDIILCAMARFFLGNTSGLFGVSTVFGVPVASANFTPMSSTQFTSMDISIPKLLYSDKECRLLKFQEVFDSPLANYRFSEFFEREQVRVLDNTPEEILDLTREIFDRVEGRCSYTAEDDDLQRQFRAFFKPGHYGYGSAARIGREFLRKHRELFNSTSYSNKSLK